MRLTGEGEDGAAAAAREEEWARGCGETPRQESAAARGMGGWLVALARSSGGVGVGGGGGKDGGGGWRWSRHVKCACVEWKWTGSSSGSGSQGGPVGLRLPAGCCSTRFRSIDPRRYNFSFPSLFF